MGVLLDQINQMLNTSKLQITPEILKLISELVEFKGGLGAHWAH